MPNEDSKYYIKYMFKEYLLNSINKSDNDHNNNKIKSGRPSSLSNLTCLDACFLCSF